MKRYAGVITIVMLALSGVSMSAQKVKAAYDRSVEFSRFKTYAWAQLNPASMPLLRLSIIAAIDDQLQKKGLAKANGTPETTPDLIIAYAGTLDPNDNAPVSTPAYPGFAGPPPSINANMWTGQTVAGPAGAAYFPKGTLVVELMDPRAAKIIWRASGSMSLDPEKKGESLHRIDNMIAKMFAQYPPGPGSSRKK